MEDENDLAGYCAALAEGFIVEKEGIVKWLESFDRENMRVLRCVAAGKLGLGPVFVYVPVWCSSEFIHARVS